VTHEVKVPNERRLSVESWGDPDGEPVFLMHGTPGSRNGPRPRGIVLYRLGVRLISFDRPGYPGSTRQPGRTVADVAHDVEAVADYFGLHQFSVVGRSGGGPHALACAAVLKERVTCAAALCSLAPYDAEGLKWGAGMADSNVRAYRNAEADLGALITALNHQAGQVRSGSEGLLKLLWPELVGDDKEVIGDIAIRRIIARVHAEALRDNTDGWIDDVVALSRPWKFELSDIIAPVKLWAGSDDVFSPASHTYWLADRIETATVEIERGKAHFSAVEVLPRILAWVADTASREKVPVRPAAMAGASTGPERASERQRVNRGQQPAAVHGRGYVGVVSTDP
jgi:pimeloyl-ACP methyl ester carboxylesterase